MKRASLKTHPLPLPRLDAEPDLQAIIDQLLEDHPVAALMRRREDGAAEPLWVGPATLSADACHVMAVVAPWDEIVGAANGRTAVEWRFSDPELDIEVTFHGTARVVRLPEIAAMGLGSERTAGESQIMLSMVIESFRLSVPSHGIEITRGCRALRSRLRRRSLLAPPRIGKIDRGSRRPAA